MKNDFSIRGINKTDSEEEINEILEGNIGKQYLDDVQKEIKDVYNGSAWGIVAESENKLIGYASWRKKVEVFYLETIAVHRDYQSKGIGKKLLEEVIGQIKREGSEEILNVVTDYDANRTIKFYLTNGFEISGVVCDEFIRGTKQVHLTRKL